MNDKEIAELRRRFRADKTSISRIRGAYVNEKREIISEMDQSVAMMTETEADEILSLLKKTLSGKVDTNLIDINFSTQQVMESPEHKLLCNLRETALQDDEQLVLGGVHDLVGGEADVQEVGIHLTRQGLFQQGQDLVGLGLGHHGHGLIHLGDDLPLFVDVGAADTADAGLIGAEATPQLGYFFIVHGMYLFSWDRLPL